MSSSGGIPRSERASMRGTVTVASLPLDGVTSTWVMIWVAFSS